MAPTIRYGASTLAKNFAVYVMPPPSESPLMYAGFGSTYPKYHIRQLMYARPRRTKGRLVFRKERRVERSEVRKRPTSAANVPALKTSVSGRANPARKALPYQTRNRR
jgi:hypothetical protein